MIGDALGDLKAAKENGVLFFPINPGAEEESWKRFLNEVADLFQCGRYSADFEAARIAEFENFLPAAPPWLVA
jgi:hypothetical protein